MKITLSLLLLIGINFISIPAFASKDMAKVLKHAQAELSAGHYDTAYPEYLKFANKNNALAQFTVGMFHQLGWGSLAVDQTKACNWHKKAAMNAIPTSAHFYADCLQKGINQPSNPIAAAEWYKKAAGLGHFMSLCSLSDLFMTGKGVVKDPKRGLQLCQQAAEKGAIPARLKIAHYYLQGDVSIRNPNIAYQWFESAAQSSPVAQYQLGEMNKNGIGTPVELSKALFWFETSASQGYVPAYFATAKLYSQAFPDLKIAKPSADNLAKTYMWLSAAERAEKNPAKVVQIQLMLKQVHSIMPETWIPKLQTRVEDHFTLFPLAKSSTDEKH